MERVRVKAANYWQFLSSIDKQSPNHYTFHLKYATLDKQNLKYRDPTYNAKRIWISRLLAQFLQEQMIVISVDKSNFRSDKLPSK